MNKKLLITAAIFGILGIILGAFAAHGLKNLVDKDAMDTFETGVRYQMYHAILLLFLGVTNIPTDKTKSRIWMLIIVGVILFSGSIYGLATNELSGFDFKKIGFVTPIGGILLIISWLVLLVNFIRIKSD